MHIELLPFPLPSILLTLSLPPIMGVLLGPSLYLSLGLGYYSHSAQDLNPK